MNGRKEREMEIRNKINEMLIGKPEILKDYLYSFERTVSVTADGKYL